MSEKNCRIDVVKSLTELSHLADLSVEAVALQAGSIVDGPARRKARPFNEIGHLRSFWQADLNRSAECQSVAQDCVIAQVTECPKDARRSGQPPLLRTSNPRARQAFRPPSRLYTLV